MLGDHGERDEDEELISDDDEDDEDEEYDKYPDPDYVIGTKKRRNSETSELSRVSAAEEETNLVNGDHDAKLITNYEFDPKHEVFGDAGDQTEEISDENKSIVWFLVKQVRPGMDLSKVVLHNLNNFEEKLKDHGGVDILLGDGRQPEVGTLDVEEGGARNVRHG